MTKRIKKSAQKGGANSDYQTPRWVIDRFLETQPDFLVGASLILEPNAGVGNIVRAVRNLSPLATIYSFEINPAYEQRLQSINAGPVYIGDCFNLMDEYPGGGVLITNPAFPISYSLLRSHWVLVDHIVFLHRVSFLGSLKRSAWLRDHTPDVYLVPERPSFTSDGQTDQEYYAWMHWETAAPKKNGAWRILKASPDKY